VAREIAKDLEADDAAELREFAAGGGGPSEAAPAFEKKLREKLWRLLRRQPTADAGDPELD
jgi:hypothetical protein